jgi:hypothetical protein
VSRLTVFLARLIGLFALVMALAGAVRRQATLATLDAIVHSPDMLLVLGMIALVVGLAMVLRHNVWSGGAAPVIVTVIGWIMVLRGGLCLFLSPDAMSALLEAVHFEDMFYVYMAVILALGLYLTYAGFRSAASPSGTERA